MPYESPDANILKINGQFGSIFATGNTLYSGNFFKIYAITDCQFNQLSSSNISGLQFMASGGYTLGKGMEILGDINTVSLSGSAAAILYKH
jgi:hypothetical protein